MNISPSSHRSALACHLHPKRDNGGWRLFLATYHIWLCSGLLVVGVGLRGFQYSCDRSLWLDEAFVATNLVHKSHGALMHELTFDQRAPAGFLLVEKSIVDALGHSDWALRLFPWLCGLASLMLFHFLGQRFLPAGAAVLALALVAFSPALIYYAAELKQYSTEVVVTLLLLLSADRLRTGDATAIRCAELALVGVIGVWFSFPAPFLLAGVGLCLTSHAMWHKDWPRVLGLAAVGAVWVVSFAALYEVQLRHFPRNVGLIALWDDGYMPLPPRSFHDCKWFVARYFGTLRDITGLSTWGLAGLTFLIGVCTLAQRSRLRLSILLAPIAIALLVSGLRFYPFQGRLLLYLVPIVSLLIALGAWRMVEALATSLPSAAVGLVVLLVGPIVGTAGIQLAKRQPYTNCLFKGFQHEDMKPVMAHIKSNWQTDDIVYLYSQSNVAFEHYADRFGFRSSDAVRGMLAEMCLRDWSAVGADLEQLRGRRRVWVLFSHVNSGNGVDEDKLHLYFLDRMGHRLDVYRPDPNCNCVVYLYDLGI